MAVAIVPARNPEWWREAPPPRLYKDVAYQEYGRWAAINHSTLRHFARSPLHARYVMLHPDEPTEAQAFGSAVHKAVLEPESFDAAYCWAPKFDKRTTVGKTGWEQFQNENKGKGIIQREEFDLCVAMRDSVWSHPTAAQLLRQPGANELSAVWVDKETQATCKGRLDRFGPWANWPTVVDLKTARDASPKAFSRAIETFGYAEQAAMYLDGLDALSHFDGDRRFVFIAVEKLPPFAVAVYELDVEAIRIGRNRYRAHLRQYAECMSTNQWPGLGDGMDLISLPAWSFATEGEE